MNEIGNQRISKVMLFILRIFGIWQTNNTSVMYNLYGYLFYFLFAFIYTICLSIKLFQLETTAGIISAAGMTLTCIALNIKIINLYHFIPKITVILSESEQFRLVNREETSLAAFKLKIFSVIAYSYYFVANMAGFASYLSAGFAQKLPYPGTYPFLEPSRSYAEFVIVYLYQVIGMIILCNINVTMEVFPSYLLYLISIRMEVIGIRLKNLGKHVINLDCFNGVENPEQIECKRMLINFLSVHQDTLRFFIFFMINNIKIN